MKTNIKNQIVAQTKEANVQVVELGKASALTLGREGRKVETGRLAHLC